MKKIFIVIFIGLVLLLAACGPTETTPRILKLATTTSVENAGLLAAILPDFEKQAGYTVEVIAVGTGQALALGEAGDVDVLLVHALQLEKDFVAAGYGTQRNIVMYNDFVIVGPSDDPAGVAAASTAAEALLLIADQQLPFVSRGDSSGTYTREQEIWAAADFAPDSEMAWYLSIGQGMGATLNFANESLAYTLTDRGTYLAQMANLPNLTIVFGGADASQNPDDALMNIYSVIPINPEMFSHVDVAGAEQFVDWLCSTPMQETIGEFRVEEFGQSLFYPVHVPCGGDGEE